jgi:hypothetical protein
MIFRASAILGCQSAADALCFALRDGRMRTPSESADAVIALLGMERSRNCTCLPGYRGRFLSPKAGLVYSEPQHQQRAET